MSQARNLGTLASTVTANGAVSSIATASGFSITETGGKLVFAYGANTIGTLDSTGNFMVIGNITGFGP
jgi:hypothetical protein